MPGLLQKIPFADVIEQVLNISLYIYFIVVVVAAIYATIYRNHFIYPLNYIWIYLWLDVLVEAGVYVLRMYKTAFVWLYESFGPIEFSFVCFLYFHFFNRKYEKVIVIVLGGVYTVFTLLAMTYLSDMSEFNLVFLVRSLLMAIISLYYLLKVYKSDVIIEIYQHPLFWIAVGLFIFCTWSIFSMGLGGHIIRLNPKIGYAVFLLNPLLNIYLYTMFLIGLVCSRRNPGYY